jgi:O-antigen ligase
MNDVPNKNAPQLVGENDHPKKIISACVLLSLPLLMIFPKYAGWLAGAMAIGGFFTLLKHRVARTIDWQFVVICVILPLSYAWNMLIMGWESGLLERPAHLIGALMIYLLIGQYGMHRNTFFYAACLATFVAIGIALYEGIYLGNERVFGLGQRWNAVPFGNFSILFGFFCLSGIFSYQHTEHKPLFQPLLGMAGFICGLVASILSGTRGGMLALPFLFLLCVLFNVRVSRQARSITLILTLFAMAVVIFGSERFQDRISQAKEQVETYVKAPEDPQSRNNSVGIRLGMWHWGIKKFLEQPLTGIGIASYKQQRQEAVKAGELPAEFSRLANLHNELITSLAFGGLTAAAALVAFWVLGWRFFFMNLKTADDDQYYFALCGLVTVLGTALFSMTEGLFGTSPGTKAIMLSLAIPAGALRYYHVKKNLALTSAPCNISKPQ